MGKPLPLPAGYHLTRLDEIDSTNREARRRIDAGNAAHGVVVTAASQTAGRGRLDREWISPPGNLYFSLVAAPPAGRPVAELAFVAAVALGDALAETLVAPETFAFKWPNDVLVNGRKAAGILIELAGGGDKGPFAVIGVGLNLNSAPEDVRYPATSIADALGEAPDSDAVLAAFCQAFEEWFARWAERGLPPVRANWLARASGLGSEIEAQLPGGELIRGEFVGLDAGGELLIRGANNKRWHIAVADVLFPAE